MYLYLAVSTTIMSAALVRKEDKKQLQVYYVSQAFQEAEAIKTTGRIKAQAKWVETKALSTITEVKIQSFVWKNIILQVRDSTDDHIR